MKIAADVTGILLLAVIAVQDFKSRLISWWLIPLLLGAFITAGLATLPGKSIAAFFSVNLLLLLVQGLLIFSWFSIRNRRWTNIVNTAIGLGDLLFLVCMASAFSTLNFIAAFVAGLFVTLLVFSLARFFHPGSRKEIPLAGMLSILMIGLLGWKIISPETNFYSDDFLLSMLTL
ncbi:MAG: type IV leader peptidase [Bacteroidetes bacterium]|nr:MAG: type IV leader peptidase [Bacteroidota bacterium]